MVVEISVCSNIYFIKRIAKWKKGISLIPPPFTTAEIPLAAIWQKTTDKKWKFQILVSTCSWAAAQAGSTNCKIAVRVECDTFTALPSRILLVSLKELPNEKNKIFSNSSTCYNCPKYALAAIWQKKNWLKMKIPNSGLNVFLSGSTCRVYQLQDRSLWRMRYLHYPTLENTRSFIKRIAKRKKNGFFLSNSSNCYNCSEYALAAIWQKKND